MESITPPWLQQSTAERKSTVDKRYKTQRWKNYSVSYRIKHPECLHCKQKGIATPSAMVDHIIRTRDDGSFDDPRNHQALCETCHRIKSDKERFGLTLPYMLNKKGEKIPYEGGVFNFIKNSLPTLSASSRASQRKILPPFYHGGIVHQLQNKPRYDFPYFFGTDDKMLALNYARLNKGHLYQFNTNPTHSIDWKGNKTLSGDYIAMIYEAHRQEIKSLLVKNCIDFGQKVSIVLITDFSLVKNLVRV